MQLNKIQTFFLCYLLFTSFTDVLVLKVKVKMYLYTWIYPNRKAMKNKNVEKKTN